jgi:hypothetical protein
MPKFTKSSLKKIKKEQLVEMLMSILDTEDDSDDDDDNKTVPQNQQEPTLQKAPVPQQQQQEYTQPLQTTRSENDSLMQSKGIPTMGDPGRRESIQIGPRPNLFLEIEKSVAQDKEVKKAERLDKILKPVPPSERGTRMSEYVTLKCDICGNQYRDHVSAAGEGRIHKCNNCIGR